jgi:hypothetical protein
LIAYKLVCSIQLPSENRELTIQQPAEKMSNKIHKPGQKQQPKVEKEEESESESENTKDDDFSFDSDSDMLLDTPAKDGAAKKKTPKKVPVVTPVKKTPKKSESKTSTPTKKAPKVSLAELISGIIKKNKAETENQEYFVPQESNLETTIGRFKWTWNQILKDGGILSKPTRKEVENVNFYQVGLDKTMIPHYFYAKHPEKDYRSINDVLKDDNGVKVTTIKSAYDQVLQYVKPPNKEPEWNQASYTYPALYRRNQKRKSTTTAAKEPAKRVKKSPATEKVTKKKADQLPSRIERANDFIQGTGDLVQIPKEMADNAAEQMMRLFVLKAMFAVEYPVIKRVAHLINEHFVPTPNQDEKTVDDEKPNQEEQEEEDDQKAVEDEKETEEPKPDEDKTDQDDEDQTVKSEEPKSGPNDVNVNEMLEANEIM